MKQPQHSLQIASPGTDRRVRNDTTSLSSYFEKAFESERVYLDVHGVVHYNLSLCRYELKMQSVLLGAVEKSQSE